MRALICLVLLAGEAAAAPSYYGWLPATTIIPDRGTELETWIAERDDLGDTHLRETTIGAAPVFAATERTEIAVPFELVRATENGVEPLFTLRAFALEARHRFAGRDATWTPFLKAALERDVTVRNLVRVRIAPVIAYQRRGVHVVVDAGISAEANRGGFHIEARPGAGVSFCIAPELRAGAELHAELSLDDSGRSWAMVGPNLAWIRRRSWLVAAVGIGVYNARTAPRIVWGLRF